MIILRIFALLFFTIVTALQAQEHSITPAQQAKARRISVFSFYTALVSGLISAGAHVYASAALRMARELHNLKKAPQEISNYATVELIKWTTAGIAIFFTINAILHLKDAYYTKTTEQTVLISPKAHQ